MAESFVTWPFEVPAKEPHERSTLDRLRSRARPDLARDAIAFRMARTDLTKASADTFDHIAQRYGIGIQERASLRQWAYESAVVAFVSTNGITIDGRRRLGQVQRFLDIGTAEAQRMYEAQSHTPYEKGVIEIASQLSPARTAVTELARAFAFDETDERKRQGDIAAAWAESLISSVRIRRRITDEEHGQALAAVVALGLTLSETASFVMTSALLAWFMETGEPLTPIPVDINLLKSESCYATYFVLWRVDTKVDRGPLYLTNSRIIFNGERGLVVVKYSAIVIVERLERDSLWADNLGGSLLIKKSTGKPITVQTPSLVDAFYITINRLIRGEIGDSGLQPAASATKRRAPRQASPPPEASPMLNELLVETERRTAEGDE